MCARLHRYLLCVFFHLSAMRFSGFWWCTGEVFARKPDKIIFVMFYGIEFGSPCSEAKKDLSHGKHISGLLE